MNSPKQTVLNRDTAQAVSRVIDEQDDYLSGSEAMLMLVALSAVAISLLSFSWL